LNPTIAFTFNDHSVNIASDFAAALLSDALHILSLDARLLPNRAEQKMLRRWQWEDWIDDPGRNVAAPAPVVTADDRIAAVYEALYNRAVGKYKAGGFPCFVESERRWKWEFDPWFIAREMNASNMFDFTVSPVHVERAQGML
jgi:hypothetical protein